MTDPEPLMRSDVEGRRIVIHLTGEIDLSNADGLETQVGVAAADLDDVVIDLTEVDFIDSRGLRLIKRISTAVATRNATLAVVAPPHSIARSVLDVTGMTEELTVLDSLQGIAD